METKGFQEAYTAHLEGESLETVIEEDDEGLIEWEKIHTEDRRILEKIMAVLATSRKTHVNCSNGKKIKEGKITGKIEVPKANRKITFTIDITDNTISIGGIIAESRKGIEDLITQTSKEEEKPVFREICRRKTQNGEVVLVEEICMNYFLENRITEGPNDWRITIGKEELEINEAKKLPGKGVNIKGSINGSEITLEISYQGISTLNGEELVNYEY